MWYANPQYEPEFKVQIDILGNNKYQDIIYRHNYTVYAGTTKIKASYTDTDRYKWFNENESNPNSIGTSSLMLVPSNANGSAIYHIRGGHDISVNGYYYLYWELDTGNWRLLNC